MPLLKNSEIEKEQSEYIISKDVSVILCSPNCLLTQLSENARVVRTGQTSATELTVILDSDHLLLPLSGSPRSCLHVLGEQQSIATSKSNWKKLLELNHPSLMKVFRICSCMAEVEICRGDEFEDVGTTPKWKKLRDLTDKVGRRMSYPYPFVKWKGWMSDLAKGLAELERLSLAHGDPYPFNAILDVTGAKWLDFSHLSDDPFQINKDAWAFILFTVIHTHRNTDFFSKSLMQQLALCLHPKNGVSIFGSIIEALSKDYPDLEVLTDGRQPSHYFSEFLGKTNEAKADQSVDARIQESLVKASSQYFSDFLHHIKKSLHHVAVYQIEKQRNRLMEREMIRLTVPKTEYERAVVERDGQIAIIKQALSERDEQIASLNRTLTERDTYIANLNRTVVERDTYISSLNAQISAIENSKSWQITKPFRVLFRIIRNGGLVEDDRSKLFLALRNIYRKLPFSFKAKYFLRKIFFKVTGWSPYAITPHTSKTQSDIYSITDGHLSEIIKNQYASHSITPKSIHLVKPYFGVRRPHGQRRVAILTNQLLDWNDSRLRFGGGERYALELARLLKALSFDVTFYQPSFQAPGVSEYYSFKVVLLPLGDSVGEFHFGVCSKFTELTADFDHVYYHMPEYTSGTVREDSLMTCHGIWFDHNNYPDAIFRTPAWFEHLYNAFGNPKGAISVDTNSIGFIRSLWPELARKMHFIPNFYDEETYYPDPGKRNPDRITVLFPRRSQINRGTRIFGDIVSKIPYEVEIIWLGEGDPLDTQIIKDVCANDKRVSFNVADFDQMPAWYQKTDIAVIPTIACEGTSLSCIEALACGCAVVATNVGGLPDVVYDGLNGLLVDPDANSIANAINRLIEDHDLRKRLQLRATETAPNFELKMWRAHWVELLRSYGWIDDQTCAEWLKRNASSSWVAHPAKPEKWIILTRNAIHGGVESLIREEAKCLNAPIVVCGGHDRKDTCPFDYFRADDARSLEKLLKNHDVILYHWLPDWAIQVIKKSNKKSIEFVHRTDTSESDKTAPNALVTHSSFLANFVHETYGRSCRVVDHAIALDRFVPTRELGICIGAISSYYETKGIDIFLKSWALLKDEFYGVPVRFYGAGDDLPKFKKLASDLGLEAEFRKATIEPWKAMKDFRCFVVPSRIEGLPVAILEALAMNIPVVASALPGMIEFNELSLKRGYESYINLARPEDPEDLARVIRNVLNNKGRQNSNDYIKAYYSAQKHCSDLISIMREVCLH
jgi:glycosyltransferase involved in cell wall biosynthesis